MIRFTFTTENVPTAYTHLVQPEDNEQRTFCGIPLPVNNDPDWQTNFAVYIDKNPVSCDHCIAKYQQMQNIWPAPPMPGSSFEIFKGIIDRVRGFLG